MNAPALVGAAALEDAVTQIFVRAGVAPDAARMASADLVAADVEGVASHGVMLVPMYVERLKAGSVSTAARGRIVSDRDAAIVIDAENVLGQLTARQAVDLAAERAKKFGLAAVAVRNAFHFGTAGRYARMLAERDCVGIVMSNTRPLMPATGGAEAITGNNPLAIAVPGSGPFDAEVDMALSAAAMGKIRNAAAAGQAIPSGWATDAEGADTTDPEKAIAGMLLPAAGPKGFGLAFIIDLLCGGLSEGGIGAEVKPLFGDRAEPYNCANLFIAIHAGHFTGQQEFRVRTGQALETVSRSRPAPGVERVFAPGELAYATRQQAAGTCRIAPAALSTLVETGRALGLDVTSILEKEAVS